VRRTRRWRCHAGRSVLQRPPARDGPRKRFAL